MDRKSGNFNDDYNGPGWIQCRTTIDNDMRDYEIGRIEI